MNIERTIKTRKSFVESLLRIMHTANHGDCDNDNLKENGLGWIVNYRDREDQGKTGLSGSLHNALSRQVYALLTDEEREEYDRVGCQGFDTNLIKD